MNLVCRARYLISITLISATMMAGVCGAQSELTYFQDEPTDKVNIVAYKNPDSRPYKAFIRAMDANEQFKTLAPKANVNFQLVSILNEGRDVKNIRLRFVGANTDIPILLSEYGLFRLEKSFEKEADNAELIVFAKSGTTKFKASVRTPEIPENERRLGDLRLECEMEWAMNKEDLPFVMRTVFSLGGGLCHSSKIGVTFLEMKKFKTIWLVDSSRKVSIYSGKGVNRYVPPIYDQSWGNEAKLVFEYDDEVITSSR